MSVSILRAGISDPQTRYFFSGQVLEDVFEERVLGRQWLWNLPALARANECAFVILRVSTPRAAFATRILHRANNTVFHLPVFVSATVDIADRPKLLRNFSLRSDVRRIRQHGYQYSISRKKRDLDIFIGEYHHPHVRRAHGFGAIEMDFERLLASCLDDEIPEPWVLLKVELQGAWIAGGLLFKENERAAIMELGVKNGDLSLVKKGALAAVYWLSMDYLYCDGHRWVSLMHTPPFLRNGVLQYKLKFSPAVRAARPADGFLLLFQHGSDAVREIMLREPLLVFKGDALGLAWFSVDPAASPDPACIPLERLAVAGINDVERVLLT